MSSDFWYLVVSNDEYELPWGVLGNWRELYACVSALGDVTSYQALVSAPDGIAITDNHKFKVLRINKYSGKVLVGKMPPKKNHGKRKRKR